MFATIVYVGFHYEILEIFNWSTYKRTTKPTPILINVEIIFLPFQDGAFLTKYACRDKKMPVSPFLFIKWLVGIVSHFSNSQWVYWTHICIKMISLLAIVIEIIFPSPLCLWSGQASSKNSEVPWRWWKNWKWWIFNPCKYYFFHHEINYIAYIISVESIRADSEQSFVNPKKH